jgi:glucose/arabinose dehydrogenase
MHYSWCKVLEHDSAIRVHMGHRMFLLSLFDLLRAAAVFVTVVTVAADAVAAPRSETVTAGLENPWGVSFLSAGRFLVTERPGGMRVIEADGKISTPVAGLPAIVAGGQGGLLDVLADSQFASNRTIYFCFSEPNAGGGDANGTALARAKLSADRTRLGDTKIIFSQKPKVESRNHFGCRIVEERDGNLF